MVAWPLEELFWRHTPEHHVIFVRDDMTMRSTDEFRLVLIPFYGILAIFLTTLPVTAALWAWASPNVALLWVATTMGYVVAYEWLHLAYHLPEDSFVGRRALVRRLRNLHRVHHDTATMTKGNFNITFPIFDWLMGTYLPEPAAAHRAPTVTSSTTTTSPEPSAT